ncbi:hypothetical protein [Limnobacter sp.]|uniref:hypothetical protein n=1 Tax=Limnobacter sp. TaxID=2003368 RepID=UPI002FE18E61
MIKVLKWIAVVALAVWLGLTSCAVLEDDETLIDLVEERGEELAPIAKIIWDEDPIAIVDLRGGDITTESGREVRIEPESLISKLSDEQIEALADAGVRLAHHDSFYGGVLFITGEGGISISGAVTGLIWKGSEFNPELIVSNVKEAVEKETESPDRRKNYWFIRPVNDRWGIFYQVH